MLTYTFRFLNAVGEKRKAKTNIVLFGDLLCARHYFNYYDMLIESLCKSLMSTCVPGGYMINPGRFRSMKALEQVQIIFLESEEMRIYFHLQM